MIPKPAVKLGYYSRFKPFDLFEIDKRRILGAEHSVQIQQVERPPNDMRLRGGAIEILLARKEIRRFPIAKTEFLPPVQ